MPTLLITGANRGLGLEFVRHYAADGWDIHACARDPARIPALSGTGTIVRHRLDVTDWTAIGAMADLLQGTPIDLLLANAGVIGDGANTLGQIDTKVWTQAFLTNALAPLKLAEAFRGHVAGSEKKLMVAITSRLGSIALNEDGGRYAYRASKAALNMAWRSLAVELKGSGVTCAVLHPGWVATDMGGGAAPVTPAQSVAGMTKVIAGLTPAKTGGFFDFEGRRLDW